MPDTRTLDAYLFDTTGGLFALAADPAFWWTGVGAVSITLLFRFVSLPMIEGRMLERRPGYAQRVETTPVLIPRLRAPHA